MDKIAEIQTEIFKLRTVNNELYEIISKIERDAQSHVIKMADETGDKMLSSEKKRDIVVATNLRGNTEWLDMTSKMNSNMAKIKELQIEEGFLIRKHEQDVKNVSVNTGITQSLNEIRDAISELSKK